MRAAIFIAIGLGLLIGCTSEGPPYSPVEADDRATIEAALVYLDAHIKTESPRLTGVLLLEPTTQVWTTESLQSFSADPREACVIPAQMYERVGAAARKEEAVSELISSSPLWLIPAEQPKRDRLFPPSEFNGVPVSTVVTVSRPGFSSNGNEALVILQFTWSIHGAMARVRLERVGTRWRPRCAQFNYYV